MFAIMLAAEDPALFAQYGVLGLIVLAFIIGWIVPKPSHEALRKDLEKRDEQLREMVKVYEEKVIPVLTEVNNKLVDLARQQGSPKDER